MAKKKKTTKKKRGPGRPKGSTTKKKRGPGRPKGSTTKKKRGRGRPPGSKNKKSAGKRGPGRPRATASKAENILDLMDGRTKTVTLLRISHKANELLDAKSKTEVTKVEKALADADELRQKYEDAMKLIGDEIPI